ncbi:MAG: hypothetical protein ACOYPR_15300 [Saprospiraceae bacterium]|jgi:hypothetical protein
MKNFILLLLVCLGCLSNMQALFGQVPAIFDYENQPYPRFLVMAGTNTQLRFTEETVRSATWSLSYNINKFNQISIKYNNIYNSFERNGSYLFQNSYEIGIDAKFFLHGKLSKVRSDYYWGLDLRKGIRRYNRAFGSFSGYYKEREKTTKLMLQFGRQWRINHFVFDIGLPIGFDFIYTISEYDGNTNSNSRSNNASILFIPSLKIGYAFFKKP